MADLRELAQQRYQRQQKLLGIITDTAEIESVSDTSETSPNPERRP